ncbi:MAG: four helix bundle protein [Muribaculaceae bacterium]|nr:four helix bundle protein [Muribaculaceae bacterium]
MTESAIRDKSKSFAIRIVKLYHHLCDEKKEWVLSKQLLRSGTSIGANIVEAQAAVSKKDFLAKMYISFKECCETEYWLELLHETGYLSDFEFESINQDNITLKKMLSSITFTTSNNLKKNNS